MSLIGWNGRIMKNQTTRQFAVGFLEAGVLGISLIAVSVPVTGCSESVDSVSVADRNAAAGDALVPNVERPAAGLPAAQPPDNQPPDNQPPGTPPQGTEPQGPQSPDNQSPGNGPSLSSAPLQPGTSSDPTSPSASSPIQTPTSKTQSPETSSRKAASDGFPPKDATAVGAPISDAAAGSSPRNVERPANPNVIDRSSRESAKARGEINFDDLKFPIAADQPFDETLLTDGVRQLVDRKVKIRGYILPTNLFTSTGITKFILVRDNQECCFGPGAALYDCVVVDLDPTAAIDFVTRPITVTGKFGIDTKTYAYPGGVGPKGATHLAIFHIDGESAQ